MIIGKSFSFSVRTKGPHRSEGFAPKFCVSAERCHPSVPVLLRHAETKADEAWRRGPWLAAHTYPQSFYIILTHRYRYNDAPLPIPPLTMAPVSTATETTTTPATLKLRAAAQGDAFPDLSTKGVSV